MNNRNRKKISPSAQAKPPRGQKDREIARLRRELNAERRRNAGLEREVSDLRRRLQAGTLTERDQPLRRLHRKARGTHREERLLEEASLRAHHYRKRSFLRYLWESIMESLPVQVITKLVLYLRRVRVVQMIATILLAVGAVILVAVVSAAVLPFLFFGTALLAMLAFMRSRRMNAILRGALTGQHVRVMVPPRGASFEEGSFFIRNARAMAAEEGITVIVVTPYPLSDRGLGGKGWFFTARKEADSLYLARRHYFFILRRRVLDTLDGDMTVIY